MYVYMYICIYICIYICMYICIYVYMYIYICDELITRPEESYGLWCVDVCDLETSKMRRP